MVFYIYNVNGDDDCEDGDEVGDDDGDWCSSGKKSLWRDFVQTAVNLHLLLRLSFFQIERDDDEQHVDAKMGIFAILNQPPPLS